MDTKYTHVHMTSSLRNTYLYCVHHSDSNIVVASFFFFFLNAGSDSLNLFHQSCKGSQNYNLEGAKVIQLFVLQIELPRSRERGRDYFKVTKLAGHMTQTRLRLCWLPRGDLSFHIHCSCSCKIINPRGGGWCPQSRHPLPQ